MANQSFLQKIAHNILDNYSDNITDCYVILPNKRAKVFLLHELQKSSDKTIFAPEILSIEEFIQNISGIRSVDSVEILFEFYDVYCSIEKTEAETFENFANWAKILLQDFNEIDRYLLDADKILKYLEDIKDIEHWSVDPEKKTDLIEKHLQFWKKLPQYYHGLYQHLTNKGIGYQGIIYREASENLNHFTDSLKNEKFLFAGFNALNKAEETIIQHFLSIDTAKIIWDIDESILNDELHDAGLFQRKFKKSWSYYKSHPYEWIDDSFGLDKKIEIIGTPKSIGQSVLVGNIIKQYADDSNLQNVAVVLGDENLLMPVLYSLPKSVKALNITMGFPSKNNPAQLLISKLFKLHVNTVTRSQTSYTMYFKDVLELLNNPLVEPYVEARELVSKINKNNFTFITWDKLNELYEKENNELFNLLFSQWNDNAIAFLENCNQILLHIKSKLNFENEDEKITNAFLYSIYKVINKLISYFDNRNLVPDIKTLYAIYKQIIDVAEVSFEGEPLEGLQIMGVLESRVLDFETVIITSVNEGKFPAGKSSNSFIPYDVKLFYGLPTYKEKDAIYSFHFYHLLQRAKNVYLLYNSDSDGFDSGEKSRFITQLEIDDKLKNKPTHTFYNPVVPQIAYNPIVVEKSQLVQDRFKELAEKGFSPSSLISYIRNPIQFYFERVLGIKEVDEVEENIAVNTLGTIIHGTLEELYKPFLNKKVTVDILKNALGKISEEVAVQFKKIYKEGELKTGRNLLAFEVAKRTIENFINTEIKAVEQGDDIHIISLETELKRTIEDERLPFPVLLKGYVDRIEIRNGITRIIDYKTGKVEHKNIKLQDWNGLTSDIKNDKIIQLLSYAFLYEPENNGNEMEARILSFKNMSAGYMPFTLIEDKIQNHFITKDVLANFHEEIIGLLLEIFDSEIPFKEKII